MKPKVVTAWHEAVAKSDLTAFEALVNDDAVLESPALHKPQVGKTSAFVDRLAVEYRAARAALG